MSALGVRMRHSFTLPRTFHLRRVILVTFTGIVASGLLTPTAAATQPPAVTSLPEAISGPSVDTADEASATRTAQRTGKPVEVLDQTTENTQVLANPDGTFTLKSHRRAVRVKQNGVWRPIDTTLHANPDGSLTPVAADQDVTFSGGGVTPLVTVRHAGKALAFSWPAPLPVPVIDGDTATYPEVLPGVDLCLVAHADSYSQVLVVHDAKAAANPALADIRMTVTGTGLTLQVGPDGSLTATDADGVAVLRGPAPVMWDSRIDKRVGPTPSDTEPGSGRITPLAVHGSVAAAARSTNTTTELTLSPNPAALTGPDVVYPLYIDPAMGVRKQHWLLVTDNGWAPRYDTTEFAQVGYCNWDYCNGTWRARSYFEFPTAALQHRNGTQATIYRAQLYAYQVWSADHNCAGGQPTRVYESGAFGPGTAWPGPAYKEIDTQWSNAGGDCPSANLVFNVISTANTVAQNSVPIVAFGLIAANESERLQWKKFDNNPLLEVDFNFPPGQATNLRVSNEIRCHGTVITPDAQPIIYSTATDNNNPPLQVGLGHEVWNSSLTTMLSNTPPPLTDIVTSGATGQWRIPTALGNGSYSVRTAAQNIYPGDANRNLWGPWSAWYPFTIDATPPPTTPTIGAADYPRGYWGAPNGAPGLLAVSTPDADVVGYAYTFLGAGTETVPSTSDCNYLRTFGTGGGWVPNTEAATEWIPVPANLSPGYHTVHVKAFDDAHNMSAESSAYTFYVAPNTGLSTRRVEAESLTWTQPSGQNVTVERQADCCGVSWSGGAQLSFYATAAGQSATTTFTVPATSDYQLGVALTKAANYGIATFQVDGQTIGASPTDGYFRRVIADGPLPLGNRRLTAGNHTLTITITGTNPNSVAPRYTAGIDYLTLTQATRYEAEQRTVIQPAGQNAATTTQAEDDPREPGLGPFSEGLQRVLVGTAVNQSFGFSFETPVEADYALGAALSKWQDYGQFRITVDGRPLLRSNETPWDGFSRNGETTYRPFGGLHLAAGTHTLTFTVVSKNTSSAGYRLGIDFFSVVAINNVTAANFTAAMNNDGVGTDGTTASLDLNGAALSAQTLAAAGYAPGATATVNGATFTMPTPRADGADNVIAIGQTIPLPASQQVKATAVGLLVTSTCGEAPVNIGTLTFTDNTTMDVRYVAVDDWVTGFSDRDVVTLPYRNEGTFPIPSKQPTIYAIFVPSDPTKTLKSVTLPNYGSGLLPGGGCAGPTLHVLAIAPRPVATGWLGTWAAYAHNTDAPNSAANFGNQTLRTVVRPTITGQSARIRLSNTRSPAPVTIDAASIAAQSGTGAATVGTPTALTFGGSTQVTIPGGAEVYSDPVTFPTGGSGNLLVSVHLPNPVTVAPYHDTWSMPTFLATGNTTANTTGTPFTTQIDDYWYLSGVEVSTTNSQLGTVAVLGDTIPMRANPDDGPTWVDRLPGKLAAAGAPLPGGLVNPSSAYGGLPQNFYDVLDRTVLNQPNLRTVIVTLGYEELYTGGSSEDVAAGLRNLMSSTSPFGLHNYRRTDGSLVNVILMTVPPLTIDDPHPEQDAERQELNNYIRANYSDLGADGVIDIAAVLEDPADPSMPRPEFFDRTNWEYQDAYFETIAQLIADEATRFPPGFQL